MRNTLKPVQKSELFELIGEVQAILSGELPVIVGSQATHALKDDPPEVALESIECDFILYGGKFEERERINRELGILSAFQRERGYYADALSLATVVLPSNWQDRLQPLFTNDERLVAQCLEIHDLAVSKLVAGREKDLEFLATALATRLVEIGIFLERVRMTRDKVENDVLLDRLKKLAGFLVNRKIDEEILKPIRAFTL